MPVGGLVLVTRYRRSTLVNLVRTKATLSLLLAGPAPSTARTNRYPSRRDLGIAL